MPLGAGGQLFRPRHSAMSASKLIDERSKERGYSRVRHSATFAVVLCTRPVARTVSGNPFSWANPKFRSELKNPHLRFGVQKRDVRP